VASAVALATGALVALASSPALGGPAPATASSAAAPPHVMVVMMENTSYKQVMGKRNEPFAKALAKHNGLATKSYAAGHPSLPNYLALVSGSTEGVTDDGSPSSHSFPSVRTVADQLHAAGYTAEAFAEDLPAHPSADSGYYVVHHDPWEYFPDTSITVASATALSTALNSAHPPDFVWFTPNVMDDGDGETTEAASLTGQNAFLSSFIPSVQATAWYRAGGQIVIEWDESLATDASGINGGDGGHVATVVVSAVNEVTRPKVRTTVDTVGVLHSIEWRYGLPYLAGAAASANGNIDGLLAPTVTLARRAAHSAR
jgi:acid phosphatase